MRSVDPGDRGARESSEAPAPAVRPELARARRQMVDRQLRARGIRAPAVLAAMEAVPREAFVSSAQAPYAYEDGPLPIGEGQTISQPYIVAVSIEAVAPRPGDRVLEIGTGSGYSAAVLARVVAEVYTVERLPGLAGEATRRLRALGYRNVHVRCGDGTLGWPEHAPYDAIIVTAAGPRIPASLLAQLARGGRLVMPVEEGAAGQRLVRVRHEAGGQFVQERLEPVAFVPLIGAEGWPDDGAGRRANRDWLGGAPGAG